MNSHLFIAFLIAATVLVLMPGPIVTLVVANSLDQGTRKGLATVAGASIGNAILVAATALGLITFFALLGQIFAVVRYAGAAYLVWLGVRAWREHGGGPLAAARPKAPRSSRALFLQGFLIAITNPKTIVFYIAFLPQFIDRRLPAGLQLLAMSCAIVVIASVSDSAYALLAGRVRGWFAVPARRRLQGRITGSLLIGTGCGLLLARRGS
jgi:threonine/homoserine/homoserine lactone efflux protein